MNPDYFTKKHLFIHDKIINIDSSVSEVFDYVNSRNYEQVYRYAKDIIKSNQENFEAWFFVSFALLYNVTKENKINIDALKESYDAFLNYLKYSPEKERKRNIARKLKKSFLVQIKAVHDLALKKAGTYAITPRILDDNDFLGNIAIDTLKLLAEKLGEAHKDKYIPPDHAFTIVLDKLISLLELGYKTNSDKDYLQTLIDLLWENCNHGYFNNPNIQFFGKELEEEFRSNYDKYSEILDEINENEFWNKVKRGYKFSPEEMRSIYEEDIECFNKLYDYYSSNQSANSKNFINERKLILKEKKVFNKNQFIINIVIGAICIIVIVLLIYLRSR